MAATRGLSKEQQDRTRAGIQATQLVKRLQQFALGQNDDAGQPVNLDADRIRAIDILLKKAVPDLRSVEHTGPGENGEFVMRFRFE